MLKFFAIAVTLISISACNGGSSSIKNPEVTPVAEKQVKPALVLSSVDFAGDEDVNKVKVECSMLQKLTNSIIEASNKDGINLKYGENATQENGEKYVLKVTYVNVIPHKWRFPSVRPGSVATVKATIFKDGKELKSTTKTIGSGVALGACDRLEKIAVAGGRYISEWVSAYNYQ